MFASRWEPLSQMNRLQSEMNRLFDHWNSSPYGTAAFPALNLWEEGDNLYVEAELPGLSLEDLEIYVTGGNQLSIKGERKQPELEQGTWHRQERGFGSFNRMIELPGEVDSENVSAEFLDGVLTVTLPKSEAAKPRKISVKTS